MKNEELTPNATGIGRSINNLGRVVNCEEIRRALKEFLQNKVEEFDIDVYLQQEYIRYIGDDIPNDKNVENFKFV